MVLFILYYIIVFGCDIESARYKLGPSTTNLRGEIGAILKEAKS
jgi:hypothetical protein